MNSKKEDMIFKIKRWICDFLLLSFFIAADQFTKYFAVIKLKEQKPFVIWEGVFELHYLENTGAAFGMLKNQKALFVLIAMLVLLVIIYIIIKIPPTKKYLILHISLVLIAAGAVGNNMIDRLRFDYIIDFLYFKIINFPIFNVADVVVCTGTAILAFAILFVYKEEDLDFLSFRKKTIRQIKE